MGSSLGMARSAQQECFGDAFLLAVAGVAGCAVSLRRPDDDSIDWTLSCRLPRRPKLDVQMKTWTGDDGTGDIIRYPLRRKNYDDLILTDVLAPRILVLVTLPDDLKEWMCLSPDQLLLRRCGYWASLAGQPPSDNETSITVSVSRANLLTVEALRDLMERINEGGAL
ncbi:MAG: DUF4365 domain-containing protein [Inquilinus sp.]|uniref:DUF4365 domain-containing protein n=1 Tax=Inquilinus sp. TaxID=1932117 RepID=UPI003F2AF0B8